MQPQSFQGSSRRRHPEGHSLRSEAVQADHSRPGRPQGQTGSHQRPGLRHRHHCASRGPGTRDGHDSSPAHRHGQHISPASPRACGQDSPGRCSRDGFSQGILPHGRHLPPAQPHHSRDVRRRSTGRVCGKGRRSDNRPYRPFLLKGSSGPARTCRRPLVGGLQPPH